MTIFISDLTININLSLVGTLVLTLPVTIPLAINYTTKLRGVIWKHFRRNKPQSNRGQTSFTCAIMMLLRNCFPRGTPKAPCSRLNVRELFLCPFFNRRYTKAPYSRLNVRGLFLRYSHSGRASVAVARGFTSCLDHLANDRIARSSTLQEVGLRNC